ncbi:MAG: hypothetical protein JXM74_08180 [Fusobacteriaceae bacterium]|nr:hypothetical protein [Fusobacteriaceae bacterium]MBN2838715.1 hypothetical protein [Fusobacteriaceae bacterium]
MKKLGFFLILSILLISCTSLESVQKTNKSHREIDEKIRIWDLENAEEMIMNLSDTEKETYINIINERKEKLEKLYELENILKESLLTGDFTSLDSYVKLDTISSFRYKKLKEYDFSNVKFYVAKRDFIDMSLKELTIVNLHDESMYIEFVMEYINDNWVIKSFDEKR